MTGQGYDLTAITDGGDVDSGVPHGALLTEFVDSVLQGDDAVLEASRAAVRRAVGDTAFVDVCATVASFNAVVKIADGIGIPLEGAKEENTRDIRDALSINAFRI